MGDLLYFLRKCKAYLVSETYFLVSLVGSGWFWFEMLIFMYNLKFDVFCYIKKIAMRWPFNYELKLFVKMTCGK